MVSKSRDGELISRFSAGFGFKYVRGSSSKGATSATRGILRLLKKGTPVAITPDGPRGPRHQLQAGILWLSAMSGKPILPLHVEATRHWTVKGWDELKIPKPFATIHVQWGTPLQIDKNALKENEDRIIGQAQQTMMDTTEMARSKLLTSK